jgi:CheY-like chemotaxis protein
MSGQEDKRVVLLVEDNEWDARVTREALERAKTPIAVRTVGDGIEALQFLRRQGPYADAPRPHLILLDLNLPGMNGREILAAVKADPDLRRIPVVVLSTSAADADVRAAYDLHANSYLRKPFVDSAYPEIVERLEGFWFGPNKFSTS